MEKERKFGSKMVWFGAALLASAASASAATTLPAGMIGTYELEYGRLGICEPLARIYELPNVAGNGEVEVVAGRFYFPRVGEGRIHYDNYFETRDFETSLRGSSLVLRESIRSKGNGEVMTRTVRADAQGSDRVRMRADQFGDRWETHTDCTYRKTSRSIDQLPSDDAVGYPPISAPAAGPSDPGANPPQNPVGQCPRGCDCGGDQSWW